MDRPSCSTGKCQSASQVICTVTTSTVFSKRSTSRVPLRIAIILYIYSIGENRPESESGSLDPAHNRPSDKENKGLLLKKLQSLDVILQLQLKRCYLWAVICHSLQIILMCYLQD